LKQKLLAAARGGVETVILPEGNRKDTTDIPPEIRKQLRFKYFTDVLAAVKFALDKPVKKTAKKTGARARKK
jgi:ATP-dependent Lon protease